MYNKRTLTIADMIDIQDDLNALVDQDWEKNLSFNMYKVAMIDEFAELLGSGRNWKWWKHGHDVDVWNEKIEVIDIVHFYLSMMQINTYSGSADCILGCKNEPRAIMFDSVNDGFDHNVFVRIFEQMLDNNPRVQYIDELVCSVGLCEEEVSAIYLAKSILNTVRQTKGYSTGEYKKHIGGVEDNVFLQNYVEDFLVDKNMTLLVLKRDIEKHFE